MWSFMKWCGRTSLWVVLPPLGAWRSWRHGRKKQHQELIETVRSNSRGIDQHDAV